MTYDANGNMTAMPDKKISAIAYNFLNLPKQISQNANVTNYFYRADGVKIKKKFVLSNASGTTTINTEYLDGFQYSTPNTEPIRMALEEPDDETMSASKAGEEEAFSWDEDREIALVDTGNPPLEDNMILSFFPTAEGYYDFENFRYIYQYKDHLGNVRVSFVKNSAGALEIKDRNDYYPFGMSFLKPVGQVSMYDPMAIPYNYKFQKQELQETGFYAFKWRNYDPSMGRFFNVDPLSEKYAYQSHYNFSENRLTDGRELEGLERIDINGDFMDYQEAAEFARNTGSYVNFRDGEIPEIWKDIQEVVIQGGNREARSSSDQNDASMASNDFDSQEEVTVYGKAKSSSGSTGAVGEIISNIWNSDFARKIVSDSYFLGLSSNVAAFLGTGSTPINFTLLTRGKEPGLYFTPTVNGSIGTGIEGNVGVTFGNGTFTGDPRTIQSSFLQGHAGGVSAGLGLGVDASIGASYAPVDIKNPIKGGGFINFSGQIGVGIQGSTFTAINAQLNYQYTPVVKPIFQIK